MGRDALIEPGLTNLDFAGIKEFSLRERHRLQLRAETLNIFNHPHG
jgi:hypothetical protein